MTKKNALARVAPSTTLAAIHDQFPADRYNQLLPTVHVGQVPAGTQLAVREVRVGVRDHGMYKLPGGRVALGKVQLNQIASAAGITWVSVRRSDDRSHPHYCEFEARGRVTDFDGTVRECVGTKTIDLRDDAGGGIKGKDLDGMPPGQVPGARKFISEICASKAMNRAISDVLAIKRSYVPEELARPFIVPKLVPDSSDPVTKRAVVAGMLGATDAMFGTPSAPVDAEFEEMPATEADAEFEESHDQATGEVETGTPAVVEILTEAWKVAKAAGMTGDRFRAVCEENAGASRKEEITEGGARSVLDACNAYTAAIGGEGLPL